MLALHYYQKCRIVCNGSILYRLYWVGEGGSTAVIKREVTSIGNLLKSSYCVADKTLRPILSSNFLEFDGRVKRMYPYDLYMDMNGHDTVCSSCILFKINWNVKYIKKIERDNANR
jgi:hypothetical protein